MGQSFKAGSDKVSVSLVNGRLGEGTGKSLQLKGFVTRSWHELRGTQSATACEIPPSPRGAGCSVRVRNQGSQISHLYAVVAPQVLAKNTA